MFRNFLIISFRNLVRQKGFSLINLLGLTVGLSVSFLILLYVYNEISYDKYHKDYERVYRIAIRGQLGDMPLNVAVTPGAMAQNLESDMPETESITMFEHLSGDQLFRFGEKTFYENHLIYADEKIFDIITFSFLYGNPDEALKFPYSIVVTKSISERIFGYANSVGQTINLNNENDYTITAVIDDPPEETHLPVNFLASFSTRLKENGYQILDDWGGMMYYTYLKLKPGISKAAFEEKLKEYMNVKLKEEIDDANVSVTPYLQSINSIHLRSNLLGELKPNSDHSYIYILSLIALAILFIAAINFMNLSTARSANRAREVSIRKIMGSHRSTLILQFMGESVFLSLLAYLFSLVLIEILLPVFNNVTSKSLTTTYYLRSYLMFFFFGISLFIGLFSGSYPSFYLSAFNPIKVLQSKLRSGSSNKTLRNILVFFQFAISSGLIACTLIIFNQIKYIENKELGFNKNALIAIFLRNDEIRERSPQLKSEFEKLGVVEAASLASSIPGMSLNGSSYFPEGNLNKPWLIYEFDVDEDFIDNTFQMEIIEGRNFSTDFSTDSNAVLINETLQKSLDWNNPLGKTFHSNNDNSAIDKVHVIGVVRDFHFRSLHEKIEPTLINFSRATPGFLILRVDTGDMEKSLEALEQNWEKLNPDLPFDYEFIADSFNSLYGSERKLSFLFTYLSIFAMFIASLGLLGLISYTAEQRTKEIGIRKVLGASIFALSRLLSVEYLRLIILANLMVWPLSYYLMSLWLKNFSYRISISVWPFIIASASTLLISLIVINIQTLKTATQNPVKSLRYE